VDSTLDRRELLRTRLTLLAVVPVGAVVGFVAFMLPSGYGPWVVLVLALLLLLAVRGRTAMGTHRPRGLRLDGGAFVAGADPTISWSAAAGLLVVVTAFGLFAAGAWRYGSADTPLSAVAGIGYGIAAAAAAVAAVYVAVLASSMWPYRPAVRLTSSGVDRRLFFSWVRVPWEAIGPRPGKPAPRRPRTSAWVIVGISRPDLVLGRRRTRPSMLIVANVDPYFLARAIRWYASNPAGRAAIGTEEELARLVARLAD
jgi:hypothetical protein